MTIAGPDGALLLRADLAGPGAPDLTAVDAIARLALVARRANGSIRVDGVESRLAELLELADLGVEVQR